RRRLTESLKRRSRAVGGKGEGDSRAAAGPALGPDLAPVSLDEPARDGETEACPAVRTRPRLVRSPEAVEHPARRARGEPFAGVLDADPHVVRVGPDEHCDRTVRGRVPKGIREEVEENTLHLLGRAA